MHNYAIYVYDYIATTQKKHERSEIWSDEVRKASMHCRSTFGISIWYSQLWQLWTMTMTNSYVTTTYIKPDCQTTTYSLTASWFMLIYSNLLFSIAMWWPESTTIVNALLLLWGNLSSQIDFQCPSMPHFWESPNSRIDFHIDRLQARAGYLGWCLRVAGALHQPVQRPHYQGARCINGEKGPRKC